MNTHTPPSMPVLLELVLVLVLVVRLTDALRRYEHDALVVARCEAICWPDTYTSACVKKCLSTPFTKPGQCPENQKNLPPFDAVCLDTCSDDLQCPELKKCCRHNCGITCQHPEHLLSAVEVPPIPHDIKITEGPKKRTVHIDWNPGGYSNGTIIYLIEERHHAGRNFIEQHLSEWFQCATTNKSSHILRNLVKPGRWYQFRVAAVNENGTKGFSANSPTFSVSIRPKAPRAPQNVTVSALWRGSNGTLSGELRWVPPKSDLPIQKYKVFWSRRLHGARALDSVLVHQQVVPKDQTKFLLHDLQPNSLYFLQVQALVQFGKNRLKGQKSGLVLNTTNYTNVTQSQATSKPPTKNRIEDLRLQKIYLTQDSLKARIIWKPRKEFPMQSQRYTVTLWTGPCYNNFKSKNYFKMAATTKAPHFELYDLQFNCRYRVSVRRISEEGMKSVEDTSLTFMTPKCREFQKNNHKVMCTS